LAWREFRENTDYACVIEMPERGLPQQPKATLCDTFQHGS
jgi:hypothetical protein